MTVIFIDTNIFLHFRQLDEIDWIEEASIKSTKIVLAPIVLEELDKFKREVGKRGSRAKKAFKKIESFRTKGNCRENVEFELYLKKPLNDTYKKNDLNFKEQDHRIIATMIDYKDSNMNANICFYSDDYYPRLLAEKYGFKTFCPSEKYRLKEEKSEDQKKITELEKEIKTFKNKIPILDLRFKGDKKNLVISRKDRVLFELESEKERLVKEAKMEFRYLPEDYNFANELSYGLRISNSETIKVYNESLNEFFEEYEKFVEAEIKNKIYESLSYEVNLELINSGTFPSRITDIHLDLPSEIFVFFKSKLDKLKNKKPVPPLIPKGVYDYSRFKKNYFGYKSLDDLDLNESSFDIKQKEGKTLVTINLGDLKHGYLQTINSLIILFPSYDDLKSFKLNFRITCENLPSPTLGSLDFIFNDSGFVVNPDQLVAKPNQKDNSDS